MEMLAKNKGILIISVLLIAAFYVYSFLSNSDTLVPDEGMTASAENHELVEMANKLSNISFDLGIFAAPAYRLLSDWSVALPNEPTGRANPFDIIGRN